MARVIGSELCLPTPKARLGFGVRSVYGIDYAPKTSWVMRKWEEERHTEQAVGRSKSACDYCLQNRLETRGRNDGASCRWGAPSPPSFPATQSDNLPAL